MKRERMLLMAFGVIILILLGWMVGSAIGHKPQVLQKSITANSSTSGTAASTTTSGTSALSTSKNVVPWDYKVDEVKVGDLVGDEMVLLPNNELIANDQNYATGDQIYVLSYMSAEMATDSTGRNDVTLSAWKPIKTFKTKEDAAKDIADLKSQLKTEVDLVGVYKTELQGSFRYFAIVKMPTGQTIKQPIQEERYNSFKSKKRVAVVLEEVHDYSNYDQSMAKFRGWAE